MKINIYASGKLRNIGISATDQIVFLISKMDNNENNSDVEDSVNHFLKVL